MSLGNPIQRTDNVASKMIRVIATENQTIFTVIGGYRINQIAVFRNGVRLSNNSDFTALDGVTVTLNDAASLNDEVLFEVFDDFKVADAIVSAASTQTIFGDIVIDGDFYYTGSSTGIVTTGADGSSLTGIVTSITAGDNISVNASTGSVTITGLANTANVVADTLVVSGLSTFGGATFSGNVTIGGTLAYEDVTNVDSVGLVTAGGGIRIGTGGTVGPVGSGVVTYFGDGSQLTGIDATSLKDSGATVRVQANTSGAVVTGVLTATSFSGDGSGLTFPPKVIAFDPAALSTGAAVDTNITVTFDQNIQFAGIGTIELRSTTNSGTLIEDFDITNGSVGAALTTSGTQLIINPTSNLSDDTVVYVILPSEGIQATSGGAYYAGSNNYNFRTVTQSFSAQGGVEYTIANQVGDPSPSPTGFYRYHIFTNPGILTTSAPSSTANSLQLLSIGGGGGGGNHYPTQSPMHPAQGGGGGGAGGYVTHTGPTLNLSAGTYSVGVGTGGHGGTNQTPGTREGYPGTDTTLTPPTSPTTYLIRSYGGGGGGGAMSPAASGYENYGNSIGQPGGSGGGGATSFNVTDAGVNGGNQVPGQGYAGRNSIPVREADTGSVSEDGRSAGGGGGAGGQGTDASTPQRFWRPGSGSYPFTLGGTGGPGAANGSFASPHLSLSGLPADKLSAIGPTGLYGAGGGGGGVGSPVAVGGVGGAGGGGHGQGNSNLPQAASDARPATIINNMAPGPYPSYPTYATFSDATGVGCGGGGGAGGSGEYGGDGTDGVLMIRYAVSPS